MAPLDSDDGVADLQPDGASLRRIIGAGVEAIPILLEHLNDVRPLKSQPTSALSASGVRPVYLRLATSFEDDSLKLQSSRISKARAALKSSPAEGYELTVGDLCYFAIGQIVNRPYFPMQYVGTFQIAVESPQVFPEIVDEMRAQWGDLTVPRHRELLKKDLAQSEVLSKRANAYARMATFYPAALSEALCEVMAKEDHPEAPGYLISDLDYDADENVSKCIAERIVSLMHSTLTDQQVLVGLACVDQLLRREFGLSDAKKFLEAASTAFPESQPIAERLAALPG
ncbi:MAG: hypothetical protein KDB90_00820 [Planctomycetes bacterium]|nr:hypothetical protein [Planctomycetota bacterium]